MQPSRTSIWLHSQMKTASWKPGALHFGSERELHMGPGVTATQGEQGLALGLSTFAFTICFAVWTIFAIIGIEIKAELGLNDTQFGLLIGTPILTDRKSTRLNSSH